MNRKEHDLIGEMEVNAESYYGIQTLRALENFKYTGREISRYKYFIRALAEVKKAAILANTECGEIDKKVCEFVVKACDEVIAGKLHEHFVVDPIQGGAGTSTNMNANEVITNRALELMGEKKGDYSKIHPNDHLNHAQSTNDAYPTAIKIGAIYYFRDLKAALERLIGSLEKKSQEFKGALKMGRTHLQDAVPMTVGQEFMAFANILRDELPLIETAIAQLAVTNMGGTAIGTGLNTAKGYKEAVEKRLCEITKEKLSIHEDRISATSDTSSFVYASSILKKIALKLIKISNDLRLSASGPTAGIKELDLPERQPGSSIMPGKVNPVIPESVGQVCFQVIGNDLALSLGCENAQYQLNVFEPVMAYNLFESLMMLESAVGTLKELCIEGIMVRKERCANYVKNSVGIVTALNPVIGYEKVSAVAKEAYRSGRSVYEIVLEKQFLTKSELDELLKPENMV